MLLQSSFEIIGTTYIQRFICTFKDVDKIVHTDLILPRRPDEFIKKDSLGTFVSSIISAAGPEELLRRRAAGLGIEPRYPGPKPGVLPLDDPAMCVI